MVGRLDRRVDGFKGFIGDFNYGMVSEYGIYTCSVHGLTRCVRHRKTSSIHVQNETP
mgnify:CR=1 FL=1